MAFTKIAAAGIGSTGTVTLQHVVVTGSVETPVITGAASTANVRANSLVVSGVSTFGSVVATTGTFSGNVSIAGTLTYEDVTNIDSVGLITARSGIRVNSGGVVLVGSATSTGTASQPLQVTGGAYVSDNLGIGTTNPTQKLQVYDGSVNVYKPTGEVNIQLESGDTSIAAFRAISPYRNWRFGIQGGTNADFVIRDATSSRNRLGITSAGEVIIGSNATPLVSTGTASQNLQVTGGAYVSGSVGIGTNNPSDALHLQGIFRIDRQLAAQDHTYIRYFRQGTEKARFGLLSSDNAIFFNATANDSANHLVINSSGNIGVGSASPFAKLDVVGGGTAQLQVTGTEADVWLKSTGPGNTIWRILGSITNNTHRFRIYDQTNNAERFAIDTSGRVTMPYQPAFQTVGTNYSQSGADYIIIIPNVVSYNQGSHYNGSTGRFTAPIAGRYLFGFWGLSYPHNTETNQIRGFVNGSGSGQDVQFGGAAHLHILANGSILLNLNANDIFDFRYYQSSGSAKAYSSQWNMWGYLVG